MSALTERVAETGPPFSEVTFLARSVSALTARGIGAANLPRDVAASAQLLRDGGNHRSPLAVSAFATTKRNTQ